MMRFRRVVFPAPVVPTIPTRDPAGILNERLCRPLPLEPYSKETLRNSNSPTALSSGKARGLSSISGSLSRIVKQRCRLIIILDSEPEIEESPRATVENCEAALQADHPGLQ